MQDEVGFLLASAVLIMVLTVWAASIAAAVFSAKRTYRFLMRRGTDDLISRGVAAVVAILVVGACMATYAAIALSLLSLLPSSDV